MTRICYFRKPSLRTQRFFPQQIIAVFQAFVVSHCAIKPRQEFVTSNRLFGTEKESFESCSD
jgi:hypothetical protein